MHKVLTGAVAAAAIAALAGVAHAADNVCVWTGSGWVCGDGNVFPQHYTEAQGPGVTITPQQTGVMPARTPGHTTPPY